MSPSNPNPPSISIVVCTRHRHQHLRDVCIPALQRVKYPNIECFIIDGSDDPACAMANQQAVKQAGFNYVSYGVRGLSGARNRGISESTGDLVAFTDDDCAPTPNWLLHSTRHFSDPTIACVTGRALPASTANPSEEIWERLKSFDRGSLPIVIGPTSITTRALLALLLDSSRLRRLGEYRQANEAPAPWCLGLGNNMVFRRRTLQSIGPFDTLLGRGAALETGEEIDMYYRILRRGYKIAYEPKSVIYHVHRQSMEEVKEAAYTAGLGVSAFIWKYPFSPYLVGIYFGRMLNLLYASLRLRHSEREARSLLTSELHGWLVGPPRIVLCKILGFLRNDRDRRKRNTEPS